MFERFKSPKAFVLLGEALLEKEDWVSCASLLIYWLDQSFNIPLTEDDYSFNSLANNLLEQLWRNGEPKEGIKAMENFRKRIILFVGI